MSASPYTGLSCLFLSPTFKLYTRLYVWIRHIHLSKNMGFFMVQFQIHNVSHLVFARFALPVQYAFHLFVLDPHYYHLAPAFESLMAPFIPNSTFRFHPSISRLYAHLLTICGRIHELPDVLLHKLSPAVYNNLQARDLPVPISFFHPDHMGPGPGSNPTSLSSNTNNGGAGALGTGTPPRRHVYPTPLGHLSLWAYLALAFVILAVVTVVSYMIYTCYHTAGLRARVKPAVDVSAASEVKGGWRSLEDVGSDGSVDGEMTVVEGEVRDKEVGEKIGDYQDGGKKRSILGPWSERRGSGLKGLGIQLHVSSKPEHDFTSYPNESQASIMSGSPYSTCSDRSLGSVSDHEHEQDLESPGGSDCPSLSAQPLGHTTEKSATYMPFRLPMPMPLPLPLPLPPPVTPSPAQKQQVKQKRTRLRALTHILTRPQTQNQNGRDIYFELQPMITADTGSGQSNFEKGLLSETSDDSPPSPSPPSSGSQFAFFAPSYPNLNSTSSSNSNSTCNLNSNATFSWGNNLTCSPTAFPTTPITPLTPITPMTPMTPIKSGLGGPTAVAAVELQFDVNNIQFIETPARNSAATQASDGTSPPEIQGTTNLAAVSLTRAEMLWNDPKLSPVQGALGVTLPIGLGGEKTDQPAHVPVPTLATPDQVHRGHINSRLGYLRRGISLSLSSPPSPSPSSSYYSSSDSVSSPSIATARFVLDRDELKRDNLRNRDGGMNKEKGREKEGGASMKLLSPIPRPVFLPHTKPKPSTKFQVEEPF